MDRGLGHRVVPLAVAPCIRPRLTLPALSALLLPLYSTPYIVAALAMAARCCRAGRFLAACEQAIDLPHIAVSYTADYGLVFGSGWEGWKALARHGKRGRREQRVS